MHRGAQRKPPLPLADGDVLDRTRGADTPELPFVPDVLAKRAVQLAAAALRPRERCDNPLFGYPLRADEGFDDRSDDFAARLITNIETRPAPSCRQHVGSRRASRYLEKGNMMPKLLLKSLVCHDTEDNTGPDEARLVVKGVTRWKKRMNDGSTANLESEKPISFKKRARIDLFDDDHPDPDDHLGTTYALASQVGAGECEHTFNYISSPFSTAKYVLIWTVEE